MNHLDGMLQEDEVGCVSPENPSDEMYFVKNSNWHFLLPNKNTPKNYTHEYECFEKTLSNKKTKKKRIPNQSPPRFFSPKQESS